MYLKDEGCVPVQVVGQNGGEDKKNFKNAKAATILVDTDIFLPLVTVFPSLMTIQFERKIRIGEFFLSAIF